MGIMGWSSTSMAARYQHVTDQIRGGVAAKVGAVIWGGAEGGDLPTEGQLRPELRPDLKMTDAGQRCNGVCPCQLAEDTRFELVRA